jgi:hypothetical protein
MPASDWTRQVMLRYEFDRILLFSLFILSHDPARKVRNLPDRVML